MNKSLFFSLFALISLAINAMDQGFSDSPFGASHERHHIKSETQRSEQEEECRQLRAHRRQQIEVATQQQHDNAVASNHLAANKGDSSYEHKPAPPLSVDASLSLSSHTHIISSANNNNAPELSPSTSPSPSILQESKPQTKAGESFQLSIANQSAKVISAFLATHNSELLQPELINPGSFTGPWNLIKSSRSFINTRDGTFALAPDNITNPTALNLTHFEDSSDETQNKAIQQYPYRLLKGLLLLIGNDGSINGLQQLDNKQQKNIEAAEALNNVPPQQFEPRQSKEVSYNTSEKNDNQPLKSLPESILLHDQTLLVKIRAKDNDNNTPLAQNVNSPFGPTINYDRDSKSPLLWAVLQEDEATAKQLLTSGANPNIIYNNQKLVHYAIKRKLFETVTAMLRSGADFSGIVENGKDIFTYVASIEITPNQPAPISRRGTRAAPSQSIKIINYKLVFDLMYELINCGYDLQKNITCENLENNALLQAIQNHQSGHVTFLLGKHPAYPMDTPANPRQPLHYRLSEEISLNPLLLAINCYGDVPQMMPGGLLGIIDSLSDEATINELCNTLQGPITPLSTALLKYDDMNLITYLISKGGDLQLALQYYLRDGGDVNKLFSNHTILEIAINTSNIKAIEYLINAGANINLPRVVHQGKPMMPLKVAFQKNNADIIALLIKNGAKMEPETQ